MSYSPHQARTSPTKQLPNVQLSEPQTSYHIKIETAALGGEGQPVNSQITLTELPLCAGTGGHVKRRDKKV